MTITLTWSPHGFVPVAQTSSNWRAYSPRSATEFPQVNPGVQQ